MNDTRGALGKVYDVALAALGGGAIGWFAWWFLDGYGSGSTIPLVAWEAAGIGAAYLLVRRLRSRSPDGASKWVHLIWIPFALFVALMVMVVLALRSFT